MRKRHLKRFAQAFTTIACIFALVASQCGMAWAASDDWTYPSVTTATSIDKKLITFGSQGDV